MAECKHMKEVDEYNETANFFQKIKRCDLNDQVCAGAEEVCSMFEPLLKADKEKSDKMAEEPEKPEEEKKPEGEEEKPAESTESA